MEPTLSSSTSSTDDFLYFDPKATRGSHARPPRKQAFDEAIVFTVGGGNYLEYGNLQQWANNGSNSEKRIIYGSTSLVTPTQFLQECSTLGML